MRTYRLQVFALALVIVLAAGFAFNSSNRVVRAQEGEMGSVVCDGDLILSLYFAEYDYNFAAVYDEMMVAMPDMAMPGLDVFDKGQYAPLFDSMMTMMTEDMAMPESMMSEDMMTSVMEMMSDETMMMEAMSQGEGMTELAALSVDGEPAECTALRTELHKFYTALAYSRQMMMTEGQ